MRSIFVDSDMRDVRLGELAILVDLGKAGLYDAALLILEALCSRHGVGPALGIHARGKRGVGTVAPGRGIAVAVGRPVRRWGS